MELIPTQRQAETAKQIDALMDEHRAWINQVNKSLICGPNSDCVHIGEDTHQQCTLGSWLEEQAGSLFEQIKEHQELVARHKHIHDLARSMVQTVKSGKRVEEAAYDEFLTASSEFQNMISRTNEAIVAEINATDPLTGAQNRSHMRALLEDRISKVSLGITSWVLMIDLDHFKSINDDYGHEVGDQVLKGFSSVVREHIRSSDLFFRYGGEEFLLCISNTDEDRVTKIAERLRLAISRESYVAPDGTRFSTTASFGITQLLATHDVTTAIHDADKAMYAAKRAGRNLVIFASNENTDGFKRIAQSN